MLLQTDSIIHLQGSHFLNFFLKAYPVQVPFNDLAFWVCRIVFVVIFFFDSTQSIIYLFIDYFCVIVYISCCHDAVNKENTIQYNTIKYNTIQYNTDQFIGRFTGVQVEHYRLVSLH